MLDKEMLSKTLAGRLMVSTRTISRMLSSGDCSKVQLDTLALIFNVEEDYFLVTSQPTETFLGVWLSYFVEYDGGNFVVVEEEIEIVGTTKGYDAKCIRSSVPDGRIDRFRSLRADSNYLFGETFVSNWRQPVGQASFILRLMPNGNVLDGSLIYIDDGHGNVVAGKHMWLKKSCKEKHLIQWVNQVMEKDRTDAQARNDRT